MGYKKSIARTFVGLEKEINMRGNSGGGKSRNNNHNPTLKEHERAKRVSGNAIQGGKNTLHYALAKSLNRLNNAPAAL
jgi:hypothetical protein